MIKRDLAVLIIVILFLNISCGIISEDNQGITKVNENLSENAYFINDQVVTFAPKNPKVFRYEVENSKGADDIINISGLESYVVRTEEGEYFKGKAEQFSIKVRRTKVEGKTVLSLISIDDNVKYKQLYSDDIYDWYTNQK